MTRTPLIRLVAVVLIASCQSAPTVPPSTPPATAITGSQPSTPPTVRFWIDDPRYYVLEPREMVVDGDRPLLLGFDFSAPMQQNEVEDRLRVTLPAGTTYDWSSPAALRATVPAGDSFDISLAGARSRAGMPLPAVGWNIARPLTQIALYRFDDSPLVWPVPAQSWRVRLVVQQGWLTFGPDGKSALVYHGITPRKSEFSLVDLSTGQHVARPFTDIASNGSTVMDWTTDRRLLAVGNSETRLGDELGADPAALRSLEGQGGLLSPSRRYLYLWSCAAGQAWMLDLPGGREWRLGDELLPCSPGKDHVMWRPSDDLLVSEITSEAPLTVRTAVFDASGRLLRLSTVGYRPVVALADGAFVVGHRVPHAHRDDGGPFYLRDARGVEHALPAGVLFRPSSDRRLLAFTSFEGATTIANVWSVSGDPPLIMRDAAVGGWTKDGALAVVTTVP